MKTSYTTQAKPVKPQRQAGYTIRHGGLKLYIRASHNVMLALLGAVLHSEKRKVAA